MAGTDPRLGYRFGASITKRGLAPAPFFISGITSGPIHSATTSDSERSKRPEGLILVASPHIDCVQRNLSPSWTSSSACFSEWCFCRKKMSGQWGDRPLGRGMEDTVIRSQSGFSGRSTALASSRTTHRSRQDTTLVPLQKTKTTPDYLRSLFSPRFPVDSSPVSLSAVLPALGVSTLLVRKYFRSRRAARSFLSLFHTGFVAFVTRPLFDALGPCSCRVFGVSQVPLGACVEIELVTEIG